MPTSPDGCSYSTLWNKRSVSLFITAVTYALKVITVTEKHHSKCSKCFLLALRHALKQFHQWSVAWSVKLCWLLTTFQSDAGSAYWHPSLVSDKYVPAYRFQSVSPGSGAQVWRSCSPGWKWMVLFTVMTCCSNNCCQTSVKLLATFAFQCTTCVQEHWAAATQGWTSHQTCGLPADQISVL